jgi:hypothetical protein
MKSNQIRYTVNKEKDFTRRQVIYKMVDIDTVYFHNFDTDKAYSERTLENESRGFGEVRSALVKFDKDDKRYREVKGFWLQGNDGTYQVFMNENRGWWK